MKKDLRKRWPSMFWPEDVVITRSKTAEIKLYQILDYLGGGIYKARNMETNTEDVIDYREYRLLKEAAA